MKTLVPETIGYQDKPQLPTTESFSVLLNQLLDKIDQFQENQAVLESFYYPLLALSYRIVKISLSKFSQFPPTDGLQSIQSHLRTNLVLLGMTLEKVIKLLNIQNDQVYDQMLIAYLDEYQADPFQWHEVTLIWISQWLHHILDTSNHHGSPPFYVYIPQNKDQNFPLKLPRLFERKTWLSGFGNRFVIPNGSLGMSDLQKAELWNHLLIEENIYGDTSINHSVREQVFEAISQLFPDSEITHLDLCGGKGDFIEWLKIHKPQTNSILIDNADAAVAQAQAKEIDARVGSAELTLDTDQVNVITIIFALQWVTPNALANVLEALKPGGSFVGNVYPPEFERTMDWITTLKQLGFVEVEYREVNTMDGSKQFILCGKKPQEAVDFQTN